MSSFSLNFGVALRNICRESPNFSLIRSMFLGVNVTQYYAVQKRYVPFLVHTDTFISGMIQWWSGWCCIIMYYLYGGLGVTTFTSFRFHWNIFPRSRGACFPPHFEMMRPRARGLMLRYRRGLFSPWSCCLMRCWVTERRPRKWVTCDISLRRFVRSGAIVLCTCTSYSERLLTTHASMSSDWPACRDCILLTVRPGLRVCHFLEYNFWHAVRAWLWRACRMPKYYCETN